MRDPNFQAMRHALEADRRARAAEAYEASLPWVIRISTRLEVWVLVAAAELAALSYLAGIIR